MKTTVFKIFLTVAALVILAMASFYVMSQHGALETEIPSAATASDPTITEIASTYYGNLSRPLFPASSLGVPLILQVLLSGILIASILFISILAPRARKLVMVLTIFAIARHLLWRGFETLDFSTPLTTAIGLVVYGAEFLAFFSLVLGYFQIYHPTNRQSVSLANFPPEQLPSVDVLVCTYNEPISVLYRTLVGCKSMEYPRFNVYLCDDGNRREMAELAASLGVNYISRPENTHAKAGNLNNALRYTGGDLVLVFDADHVPTKAFLQEVVGFFSDPKLAFVQTPQHFFTPDPFQRNLVSEEAVNNEQALFFHLIQPGNDYWGATFFAGSGAIFRRQALQEIGGFAVETITEDVHTGLRLHAKGWKSLCYPKNLAAGLAQDSFADFVKQRLRWARGMTQILFFDNPLLVWGLTLPQRICYLSGIWYFFHGLPRLIFLIAPLFFLLFGYKTINAGFFEVLIYYTPSFLLLFMGYSIITRGIRQSFWSEVYETALCVYLLMTTALTMLSPWRARFRVTPKGTLTNRLNFNWRIVFPQVLIAGLTLVGIIMGIVRALYTPEYVGGIFTNLFWSGYNLVLLVGAIYVAQERPQLRLTPRVFRRVCCELRLLDGSICVGYTTNISESGIALVFDEPVPIAGTVALKVMDWDINEVTVLSVQAVRSVVDQDNRHYVGFRVVNRTDEQHQKMIRHMFGTPLVWENDIRETSTYTAFWNLLAAPFRLSGAVEKPAKRRAPRFQASMPCVIEVGNLELMGYSDEISETGLSVFLQQKVRDLQNGQNVRLRLQWPNGHMSAFTAQIRRIEEAGRGHMKLGLNFVNLTREQRLEIVHQIFRPREGLVRVAPTVQKTLPCLVNLPNGQQARAYTQEISELGARIALQDQAHLEPNQEVMLQIAWSQQEVSTYKGTVINVGDGQGQYVPAAVVYFKDLNMAALDDLSQRIHEPMDTQALRNLNAG